MSDGLSSCERLKPLSASVIPLQCIGVAECADARQQSPGQRYLHREIDRHVCVRPLYHGHTDRREAAAGPVLLGQQQKIVGWQGVCCWIAAPSAGATTSKDILGGRGAAAGQLLLGQQQRMYWLQWGCCWTAAALFVQACRTIEP